MEENNLNENGFPKEIKSDNDNISPLLDIISSIQEKLDNTTSNTNNQNQNTNYNFNNENSSKFSNNTFGGPNNPFQTQSNSNSSFDASSILGFLGGLNNSTSNNSYGSGPLPFNLDINTISRIGKIFNSINREDPTKNLLMSLKPFLRDNRKQNIDTYIFVIGILNVLNTFNREDSDSNGI